MSEHDAEAFANATGRPLKTMPELAGRTEPVIFREALKINGVEPREACRHRPPKS
ncbi:MAG: hypothetical protein ACM3ML_22255 [Micromonosporaceae bacterium]